MAYGFYFYIWFLVNKLVWVRYQLQITGIAYVLRKCYEKRINSWESWDIVVGKAFVMLKSRYVYNDLEKYVKI